MINNNNHNQDFIQYNNKVISIIYRGAKIVWEGLKSCFGGGYWNSDKPWDNDDCWKN